MRDRLSTGQVLELPVEELPEEEPVLVEDVDGVEGVEGVELAPLEPPDPDDEPDELDELGVLEESDLRESVR